MNILYTSYYAEGYGGAEVSLALAASEVQKSGHSVFVASSESYERYGLKTLKFKKYAKIPAFRMHESYLSNFLQKAIMGNSIDVVHANDRLTAVPAVLAAKRCGVPVAVQFRDYWFACPKSTMLRNDLTQCSGCSLKELYKCSSPKRFLWDAYKLLYLKRARKILHNADAKIVASRAVMEKLSLFGFTNIEIVPNPIEFMHHAPIANYKEKFNLKKIVVTFVGTLDVHKGILEFLSVAEEIIKQNKDVSFLVVGSGTLREKTDREIERKNIGSNVILAGSLPHAELQNIYEASDIVVVPSLWAEPFGRVAVEAMLAGKPVVASDTGGLCDIVPREYLVRIFDKRKWLETIVRLINDKNERLLAGKRNKKYAEKYSGSDAAKNLIKIYEAMVNDKRK